MCRFFKSCASGRVWRCFSNEFCRSTGEMLESSTALAEVSSLAIFASCGELPSACSDMGFCSAKGACKGRKVGECNPSGDLFQCKAIGWVTPPGPCQAGMLPHVPSHLEGSQLEDSVSTSSSSFNGDVNASGRIGHQTPRVLLLLLSCEQSIGIVGLSMHRYRSTSHVLASCSSSSSASV